MMEPIGIILVMPGHIRALGHDCRRNSQSGRMVILVPFSDTLYENHNKCTNYHQEHDGKHDAEQTKSAESAHAAKPGAVIVVHSLSPSILKQGLSHDYELLYTKSVMDLISSAMLSASLGIGVLFSAVFVLVFQGGICMLAGVLAPFLGEYARGELICAGSVVIMLLGFNILGITKIKVADYLPALLIAPLLCLIM